MSWKCVFGFTPGAHPGVSNEVCPGSVSWKRVASKNSKRNSKRSRPSFAPVVMAARNPNAEQKDEDEEQPSVIAHLTGAALFAFLKENNATLRPGSEAEEGDIVVCSQTKNFENPVDIGRVLFASTATKVTLPVNHRDGDKVNMFVLTFKKQRKPRQLKSELLLLHYHPCYLTTILYPFTRS